MMGGNYVIPGCYSITEHKNTKRFHAKYVGPYLIRFHVWEWGNVTITKWNAHKNSEIDKSNFQKNVFDDK